MANQIAEFFARIFLKNEISPELDRIVDELLHLNKIIENSKHPEMLVQEKQRADELSQAFINAGGKAEDLSQILTYKGAEGARKFSQEIEKVNINSYNNFRAIGQMDRVTREFASGGLNQGLNGLTMFGNSLTRLAAQEGGFKNALTGLGSAFSGPAGIVLGISAVIGLFEMYEKNVKKATEANDAFIKSLNELNKKLYEIAGGSQAKLATGSVLANLITDSSKNIETRKGALNELKNIFSQSAEINKLDIDSKEANNKQLLMYAINRAAVQDYDINAQKNYEEQLKLAYTERNRIEEKAKKDLAAPKKDIFVQFTSGQAYVKTVAEQNKAINDQLKIDLAEKDILISKIESQNAKFINESNKFAKTGDKTKSSAAVNQAREENKVLNLELDYFKKLQKEFEKIGTDYIKTTKSLSEIDAETAKRKASIDKLLKPVTDAMKAEGGLGDLLQKDAAKRVELYQLEDERKKGDIKRVQEQQQEYKNFARAISQDVTSALTGMYNAMQHGQTFGQAFLDMLGNMVEKLGELIVKTLIFDAIMAALTGGSSTAAVAASDVAGSAGRMLMIPKYAEGGITTRPHIGMVGEAGPEAIMPLSKLGSMMNNTFSAGAMMNNNSSNNGQFTLKGSDLVLALQRSNYSLNLRRGA